MANNEHLALLQTDADRWNAWRKANPGIQPDLSEANLSRCSFCGFDFTRSDFSGARLTQWSAIDCDFSESRLASIDAQGSYWRNARMRGVQLSGDLVGTTMYVVDLGGASVKHCGMPLSELRFLRLSNTEFSPYLDRADVNSWTVIASDLSGIQGSGSVVHEYPSNIDFQTLQITAKALLNRSSGVEDLTLFLRGCGLPEEILNVFRSWSTSAYIAGEASKQTANFFSCFISYSHADQDFARRIHYELRQRGIQCWMDDDQVLPGDDIYDAVDNGIRLWDKVLLCCSENSLNSPWVDRELDKAFQKEEQLWRERGFKVLIIIPLNLDGSLFTRSSAKASLLKSRLAADFVGWQSDTPKFATQIARLVEALRSDDGARLRIPKPKV